MYGLEVIFLHLIRTKLLSDVMFSRSRIAEARAFAAEHFHPKDSWHFIEFTSICRLVFIVLIVQQGIILRDVEEAKIYYLV